MEGMYIPYYIGQEIYEVVDNVDWKGEREVRFHTYEASMITIKRDNSLKIRFSITSDKSGRQVTLSPQDIDVDKAPTTYENSKCSHWRKYFSNKSCAKKVYDDLCDDVQRQKDKLETKDVDILDIFF